MHVLDDDVPWPEDAIEVARIAGAWGVRGGIRVQPYASDPQALFSSRRWFIQADEARPRPAGAAAPPRLLRIKEAKSHGDGVVAVAHELADRTDAEALKGARIFVSRASFPTAGKDEYYWIDLLGMEVVNREGERLGTVADLMDTGAHSILRVVPAPDDAARGSDAAGPDAKPAPSERLIPFVSAYVDDVDTAARRILVDWGLDY